MILVTGGTGLVGSHLLMDLIKEDLRIRAIYRSNKSLEKVKRIFGLYGVNWADTINKIEWVRSDILNPDQLSEAFIDIDYVYHSAAMVSFNKKDKEQLFKINIEGTANVVNLCLQLGVKKLCYVSSTATIGEDSKGGVRNESCDWQNDGTYSNYSVSKYFAEMEVWRASEEGLNIVIVNPSVVIGPGKWTESSSNLFLKVWKGLKFYSTGVNGFVDVRDVSRAMRKLMKSEITSERFLVVGENLTFQELFTRIANSLNKPVPHIQVKKWMANCIWRIEAVKYALFGVTPLVTKEAAISAISQVRYSNEKLKKELDFNFIPVNEAINHTSNFFLRDQSI